MGFINQECDAQTLQCWVLLKLIKYIGDLLLRGDDDRLALRKKARQVFGFFGDANNVFQVSEVRYVLPDIRVKRLAVGEDERDVHQFVTCAGLEQAVQTVSKPANRESLAASGGMIGKIFLADVALRGKVCRDVG